jgi:hypothetical protein
VPCALQSISQIVNHLSSRGTTPVVGSNNHRDPGGIVCGVSGSQAGLQSVLPRKCEWYNVMAGQTDPGFHPEM